MTMRKEDSDRIQNIQIENCEPIMIANNGKDIEFSNYWETEYERKGLILLSVNAGEIRLLLPRSQYSNIDDYKTCEYVVLTSGKWGKHPLAFEFMLEDHTDCPHAFHILPQAFVDHIPPCAGESWGFSIWALRGDEFKNVLKRKCHTRRATGLPFLKPYKGDL